MANSHRKCKYKQEGEHFYRVADGLKDFCSEDHKIAWAIAAGRKLRAVQAKVEKQKHTRQKREFYANDYRHQFSLTKKCAQRLAALLDSAYGCISCSTVSDVQYCGGHFKTAGAHPELAIDLRNIHKQCNRYCNCGLSGNIEGTKTTAGYRAGLVARYGQGLLDYLDGHHVPRKSTCEELMVLRAEYNAEIRRLEKGLPPSRDWRALPEQQQAAA